MPVRHRRTAPARHCGAVILLAVLALLAVFASLAVAAMSTRATAAQRERISERALAHAREALIAYAADRPIDGEVGPGYLPCPDTDDDGWAESTCGSLSGNLGQAERLGRLPWKTLGLPDLRDGHGERLWYAVSTKHKGLLNCAASRDCRDLTPVSGIGTITVRDARGAAVHDGTSADAARAADGGAIAVVIAPGAPLTRGDGLAQRRDCAPGECDAAGRCAVDPPSRAAHCDPRNYLDLAPAGAGGEDNAAFVDRSDAAGRPLNRDGFIQGPVAAPDGGVAVNDRVAVVGYADLMPRVMARVALEAAQCLRAAAPLPMPREACGGGAWLGRIEAAALGGGACNLGAVEPAWWTSWQPHVLYALAGPGGLEVLDAEGRSLAAHRRLAVIATPAPGECPMERVSCAAGGCLRVALRAKTRQHPDALVSIP